jgi:hypothetical protein
MRNSKLVEQSCKLTHLTVRCRYDLAARPHYVKATRQLENVSGILHNKKHLSESGSVSKDGVFWVVTTCGSGENRRFGGTWRLLHQGDNNR